MAKILVKNSVTSGSAPAGLSLGEIAVNITDKKIFVGNAVESTVTVYDPNNHVLSFNGSTGAVSFVNYVSSLNGATGAITNVARTNEGNTFSVTQVMSAGITASNLYVTSGSTFDSIISASSTTNTLDVIASTDGVGVRIAQATSGAGSRQGGIRLGRSATTGFNTYIENASGVLSIYNGTSTAGTKLFDLDTTDAGFFVPIAGVTATFTGAVTSDGGYRITSSAINAQVDSYSLQASDNGKIITVDAGSVKTITVPSGLPVGFNCTVMRIGAGRVQFSASGTTLNSVDGLVEIASQHGAASLLCYSSNTFNLSGNLG